MRRPLPTGGGGLGQNKTNNHLRQNLSRSQGHSVAGKNMLVKNSSDPIGNPTHDIPGCRVVPQPTAPPRATLRNGAGISTVKQRHLYVISGEDFNLSLFGNKMCKGKAIPLQVWTGPEGPRYQDNRHMKVVRLSALRTGHLYTQEMSWYSFLL